LTISIKKENKMSEASQLMTIKEAADYLRVSKRTIYNGIHRKSKKPFPIKARRVGRLIRFLKADLDTYIMNGGSTWGE
jgi:excisionase family DNA binding protein